MIIHVLALVFSFVTVSQVPNPRPTHWVSDQANVLDIPTEDTLNTLAEQLYRTKQIELAIVVVDGVKGTPKQFATQLFNYWKLGSAQTNTGVLVLLVMGARRLEIETGTGIEGALPSQWLADMQAEKMVPRFKAKDFGGGLVAGVQAIHDHLAAAPGEAPTEQQPGEYRDNGVVTSAPEVPRTDPQPLPEPAYVAPPADDDGNTGTLLAGGAGLAGLGGGGAALYAWRRKRNRTCTKCQPERRMLALSEVEDDQHLSSGERKEEQLGSVDYEVLICAGCQDSRTLRHNKWFSGYSRCGSCSFKTLSSSSSTIVAATYDHGGQVQVTETCRNCSYHNTYTRYTSKLTRPSTSSSSGGSSRSFSSGGGGFGGGSSRGGGAGSSW